MSLRRTSMRAEADVTQTDTGVVTIDLDRAGNAGDFEVTLGGAMHSISMSFGTAKVEFRNSSVPG